ncbi:MAG: hypothetical protein M1572_08095 [Gammaproteobacteria bacterium]|nr:hypothetical protein [Gammaproteobacteria bacterium]MCL5796521.1 hypothetical protein [Gammaproteobacteria bacterium]HQT03386.1 hypothetical protein [Thiotrichales bacterium]
MNMSIRAYAHHRGVSHTAVQKAIKTGRIKLETDGKINQQKADSAWQINTRPSAESTSSNEPYSDSSDHSNEIETKNTPNYQKARAIREAYSARLAKLDFEERSGKLVPLETVSKVVFTIGRQLRDRIQLIPRQLSPLIVSSVLENPDPRLIEVLLDDAIRDALEQYTKEASKHWGISEQD